MKTSLFFLLFSLLAVPHAFAQAPSSPQPKPVEGTVRATIVAKGLEHRGALEFLPDGRMLVSERPGLFALGRWVRDAFREPLGGGAQSVCAGAGRAARYHAVAYLCPGSADLFFLCRRGRGRRGHGGGARLFWPSGRWKKSR